VEDWRSLRGQIEVLRSSIALAKVELQAAESRLAERSAEVAKADKVVEDMQQAVRRMPLPTQISASGSSSASRRAAVTWPASTNCVKRLSD